jgi:hypothetical protein
VEYSFERLDDKRFQDLCQTLLVSANPDVQAFPLGEADGGRDAVWRFGVPGERSEQRFNVYQVKYTRAPDGVSDPVSWLANAVEGERPKIEQLVARGAEKYHLITNVRGTGALDTGGIDRLQTVLDTLPIPAHCWWRQDIAVQLAAHPLVLWSFPELLSVQDLLPHLFEAVGIDDRIRRSDALRSYLRDQFDHDAEVKFKQVDLQNDLFALFVDVPATLKLKRERWTQREADVWRMLHVVGDVSIEDTDEFGRYRPAAEAGKLFLSAETAKSLPLSILEGAPGQGKSTLAQFLCQVHRMRLLGDEEVIKNLATGYCDTPLRLPFKVDLRDLAVFLSGGNPFDDQELHAEQTVESFLALQVQKSSGGVDFSVADLHAVVRELPALIVFDGLDEVADVADRKRIVDQVTRTCRRLNEPAASLQVIVTSRPAAYANSPGFSPQHFSYLELTALPEHAVLEYCDKWSAAKHLDDRDSAELLRNLRERLSEPHVAELARNPMQLTILLALIHQRGASLPDKRTALYDSYTDMFFAREAEKSAVVRDHRDLLVDVHGYIAWILHSRSERRGDRGSISEEDLIELVRNYLQDEGHDSTLVDQLFKGIVERVVALVQRVQGRYEFEVQPLREYFCARYLHDTSPYSPPGAEHAGTRIDRFEAIIRNQYWLNVSRFLAGSTTKGELPGLVLAIRGLIADEDFRFTAHPRLIGMMFAKDFVFSQHPTALSDLLDAIFDDLGLRMATTRVTSTAVSILPSKQGGDRLRACAAQRLIGRPPREFGMELGQLFTANASSEQCLALWHDIAHRMPADESLALLARMPEPFLGSLPLDAVLAVVRSVDDPHIGAELAVDAGATGAIFSDPSLTGHALGVLRDQPLKEARRLNPTDPVGAVFYATAYLLSRRLEIEYYEPPPTIRPEGLARFSELARDRGATDLATFLNCLAEIMACGPKALLSELSPWTDLVEVARSILGEAPLSVFLANKAAGIRSRSERGSGGSNLLDTSVPLCVRVRHARMRSGDPRWWTQQVDAIQSPSDEQLVVATALLWASGAVISSLQKFLERSLAQMDVETFRQVLRALGVLPSTDLRKVPDRRPRLSPRLAAAVSVRASTSAQQRLYERCVRQHLDDSPLLPFAAACELRAAMARPTRWTHAAKVMQSLHRTDQLLRSSAFARDQAASMFPRALAERILSQPAEYPRLLLERAAARVLSDIASKREPVAEIADEDGWFDEPVSA